MHSWHLFSNLGFHSTEFYSISVDVICIELAWEVLDFFVPKVPSNPFKVHQVPERFFLEPRLLR
jgi:hypothetical protein